MRGAGEERLLPADPRRAVHARGAHAHLRDVLHGAQQGGPLHAGGEAQALRRGNGAVNFIHLLEFISKVKFIIY